MRESTTYRAILAEGEAIGEALGRIDEARRILILQGERRFGTATKVVRDHLDRITTHEGLEALLARLFEAESWDELLAN